MTKREVYEARLTRRAESKRRRDRKVARQIKEGFKS